MTTMDAVVLHGAGLRREADELLVEVELPGVRRRDVTLDVREGNLVVEGCRRRARGGAQRRDDGYFRHAIALPSGADLGNARAHLSHGVLRIAIPTGPEAAS